jgi:acetoin utilization deacetylase AcuC-like enzyme
MDVIVASHPSSLLHDTGPRHPERPARVEAVQRGVRSAGLGVVEVEAPEIDRADLTLIHDPAYVDMIEGFCRGGGGKLDMDTYASPASWTAALTSVGAVRILVDELESRRDAIGFAVCRPPGHHATRDKAMGFCLFNNVAVAAAVLKSQGARVAILDWDVHHGNGTQDTLFDDPGSLYVSIHQDGFYPHEGRVEDVQLGAVGTSVNVPLPAWTGGDVYRRAWGELVLPVVTLFEPDWVLVSAGFDAHARDLLADMRLESSDYGWMAARLAEVHPSNRTIFALEGGYHLDALETSAAATLAGAAGRTEEPGDYTSPPASFSALDRCLSAVSAHWSI